MKKIEIIIETEQMGELQQMIEKLDIKEAAFTSVLMYHADETLLKTYRGASFQTKMKQQVKAELWVLPQVCDSVKKQLADGRLQGCRYYVYEIE